VRQEPDRFRDHDWSFTGGRNDDDIETIVNAVNSRHEDPAREKQKIIVAGCLSQRFNVSKNEDERLPGLLPEVDAFIGLDQVNQVAPIIRNVIGRAAGEESLDTVTAKPKYIPDHDTPRYRLTPAHSAYIKIAEGCNHTCSFCIIPKIRGESLASLLRELNAIEGEFWIRLLYTHPAHWSDELIQTIAECDKVAKYVDIPLQHISDHMLTTMRRKTNGDYIRDLLRRMRAGIPDIAIRTTFIVGFPEETEEDFEELLEFIEEFRFERAGIFTYSKEEGTHANKLGNHVHHMTKKREGQGPRGRRRHRPWRMGRP